MSKEELTLKSVDGYNLSIAVFKAENPKAVIQMVHGMEEHKERYYDFCEYLAKNGYSSVVSDLRGHGKDAPLLSHISDKHGERLLIQDQQKIREYIASVDPKAFVTFTQTNAVFGEGFKNNRKIKKNNKK